MALQHLYTVAEACEIARICRALLYKEWRATRGPVKTKIGRRTFITADALEDWLRSCEQDHSADAAEKPDVQITSTSHDLRLMPGAPTK